MWKSKVAFMERSCEEMAFGEMLTSFVQSSSRVHVPPLELLQGICVTLLVRHWKTLLRAFLNVRC
jgi:hypothetical protein